MRNNTVFTKIGYKLLAAKWQDAIEKKIASRLNTPPPIPTISENLKTIRIRQKDLEDSDLLAAAKALGNLSKNEFTQLSNKEITSPALQEAREAKKALPEGRGSGIAMQKMEENQELLQEFVAISEEYTTQLCQQQTEDIAHILRATQEVLTSDPANEELIRELNAIQRQGYPDQKIGNEVIGSNIAVLRIINPLLIKPRKASPNARPHLHTLLSKTLQNLANNRPADGDKEHRAYLQPAIDQNQALFKEALYVH